MDSATVYELSCVACGSPCRAIDRFCSQCGRRDPTNQGLAAEPDALLHAQTIVGGSEEGLTVIGDDDEEDVDATIIGKGARRVSLERNLATLAQMLVPGAMFARRYRIQRFLGSGAMGYVCAAVDESIDEVVALKILSRQIQEDPAGFERFKLELKLARKIRHRNVVQSFDLGFGDGYPYISMEYIDADNLQPHLNRRERFTEREALLIMRQVLRGLRAAHDLGIIHRDIKPENILLNKDRIAFITDFGIATHGDLTRRRELVGTPDYMAPEQLRCEDVTPAADLYACGVLLYRMITGSLPYQAETLKQILDAHRNLAPAPIPDDVQVSDVTRDVIQWMLQKAPGDRPGSAADVLDQIEPLLRTTVARKSSRQNTALIVESEDATTASLRILLENDGYRVLAAKDAREGVNLAFEENPDLILLDARIQGGFDIALDMPSLDPAVGGADAIGFFRILRGDQKLSMVPIIVMAEETLTSLHNAFLDAGAADLLLKPFAAPDLASSLRRAFPARDRYESGEFRRIED
jgi:serine/threonine protein kinase